MLLLILKKNFKNLAWSFGGHAVRHEMHARHAGSLAQLITSSLQLSSMQSSVSGLESFPIPVTRGTGETYLRWWGETEKEENHADTSCCGGRTATYKAHRVDPTRRHALRKQDAIFVGYRKLVAVVYAERGGCT